jgi:predicted metal-binding membrane protein
VVEREPHGGRDSGRPVLNATPDTGTRGRRHATRWDAHVVTGALALLSGVAWFYLRRDPGDGMAVGVLTRPDAGDAMVMDSNTSMSLGLFTITWLVMMIAMMFPAIAPVVLLFDRWRRKRNKTPASTLGFVLGYLVVWTAAGLVVYAALLVIEARVETSTTAIRLGGAVLVTAGLYQMTPLKTICLTKCRSPLGLVMEHAQDLGRGMRGPLRVGLSHGTYCLGCCWALMAILVVLGLMNLGWMAAVSALILVEKVLRPGPAIGRIIGIGIALAGAAILVTGSGLGT